MTTENRMGQFVPLVEAPKTDSFFHIISEARERGEDLLSKGKDPQLVAVAVHELLLVHFSDSSIHRKNTSPFDVTLFINGEEHAVFLDMECHNIVWDVLRYLVSDSQESESWNQN
ncbi:MAG: hypothetical protein QG639_377 [Patescibacteria group bacterium]|nr:hypothetical protein [Patescibacteria group bacterium]